MLVNIAGASQFAYISNAGSSTVSVIDTATNTVTATVSGFIDPFGIAVTPDGTKVYVANPADNTVYVIDRTTNTVTATVPVGHFPIAFGQFIGNGQLRDNIRKTPKITWSNPANIIYGTALSNIQLDAHTSVPGTFVYDPPVGTVLNIGVNQALTVTFIPTDIANHTTATGSAYINVTQATPTINLSNPADITYNVTNSGNLDISAPITVTDNDINAGHVTNSAYATGSFNSISVI